ncbi:single-stranded DNA-binding protein [Atopococcus tabaci]|uniref:single-stranded DNA-binding protein n=1 Tax=Atopococcus tabaci TaxID=269774 RepID=UPI0004296C06|nr:single-stranded DNA-binding protein [Atopococcus tabaci]
MINNVVLVGRLTRDIELRYTANGTAVGSFSVAVDRPFTNQQGERDTDFINCVAWRKTAETLANFTRKGSLIGVQGRIQTRNYTNANGQKVYVTEVVCENYSLLEPKSVTERRIQSGDSSDTSGYSNNSGSYQQNSYNNQNQAPGNQNFPNFDNDPFEKTSDPIDISDDDLPF